MIRLIASSSPGSKLDRRQTGKLRKRDKLLTGEGEWGRRGAGPCDRKKAWSSINHSTLSGYTFFFLKADPDLKRQVTVGSGFETPGESEQKTT